MVVVTALVMFVFLIGVTQAVLTLFCFLDAARHKRQGVGPYLIGMVLLPGISIVVGLVYLSRRDEFPQRVVSTPEIPHVTPGTGSEVQTSGEKILWNNQVRGWTTLPRRLSYALARKEDIWVMVIIGSLPLVVAVVSSEPGIALASIAIISFPWLNYLSDARKFTDTTVELDTENGTVGVSFHGGESPLIPRYGFLTGTAEDIEPGLLETVEIVRVGKQHIAWFEYDDDTSLSPPDMLPLPSEEVARFRNTLERYGVSVQDRTTDDTKGRYIRWRMYAATATLFLIPLCAVFLWLVLPG